MTMLFSELMTPDGHLPGIHQSTLADIGERTRESTRVPASFKDRQP